MASLLDEDQIDALANTGTDILSNLANSAIRGIRVETAFLPPLDLVGSDVVGPSSQLGLDIGSILKPKVTITLGRGSPIVYAPYGDPGSASWLPFLAIVGGSLFLAYKLGQRSKR